PGTTQTVYIDDNDTKIIKTTWKTANKEIAKLTKKKKAKANFKAGDAGEQSTKITANVKYKVGKKVKTKKLTCKIKVVWLGIETADARTNLNDGNTELAISFNLATSNINKYDSVPEEGEILDVGYWTDNADKVVEVTETSAASGEAVKVSKVTNSDYRGRPVVTIDLGKALTEKTSYHVTLMGFKGSGSKMIVQTDITADPQKITLSQVEWRNPENKGDISLTLSTDHPFNVYMSDTEYDAENNTYIKVKDENGKELTIVDIIVATDKTEGDQIIINLKGGADSKKFTVEYNNAFASNYIDPTKVYYFSEYTLVVDKETTLV
ncbi:MAG: hypothetical protein J6P16_00970, partial [Eubacterium sp.]|nr:hypothetical protein [Eubacterium sp.]